MAPTNEQMYQALIKRHGEALQKQFDKASVAICGLGGLGSNVAVSLARAGVGHLHLIDFDRVDVSNLNRQQYFPEQVGEYKSEALPQTIKRIAPFIRITSQTVRLTEDNIPSILEPYDIICEAFDKADQKAMLINCALEKLPGKYIVSGNGMAGLDSANSIVTRRVGSRLFICGDGSSDIADGLSLISARVAVCAAHQATVILRLIAGLENNEK